MLHNQNQVVLSTKKVRLNVTEKENYSLNVTGWVVVELRVKLQNSAHVSKSKQGPIRDREGKEKV